MEIEKIRDAFSISTPSTRRLLDGVAMPVPHRYKHPTHSLISTQVGTPNGSKKGCPENCKLGACALQWEIRKLSAEETWLGLHNTHPEAAARMRAECYIARRKSKEYAPPPPGALVV